ncbi:MAG: hypothetical protein AAFV98_00500 [Chloroflexota bacterium]
MTTSNPPDSQHDKAYALLGEIRASLEADALDDAIAHVASLSEQLAEWQRSETLQNARTWLETALHDDLLAFDVNAARHYIRKWADASTTEENLELADYEARVEKRADEKATALMVRGVIAHCDEILAHASTLETGTESPAPSFMLKQYFTKAKMIALSARADRENNPELEQLVQRVERLHNNKETASMVYAMALENQKYSNALHNLDQLPDGFLIPRFTSTELDDKSVRLQYQGMITRSAAREELLGFARTWAAKMANNAITDAQQFMDAHEPQEAVDKLDLGENVEKYLTAETKAELTSAQTNAKTQLRNREKAEERAEKALALVSEDPLAAWDEYATAVALYQWADGLDEAYKAVLKGMRSRLKGMLRDADTAFHQMRDMERVREIASRARAQYSEKDSSLDELLAEFDNFEEMTRSYENYINTGNEILTQVKDVLNEDAVAANDLLTQVESYPEFVLEAFGELYDLRSRVNQRLNADQTYNRLYRALFNEAMVEVQTALEETNTAVSEFSSDGRFGSLESWLKYHLAFLSAQQAYQTGAHEQVMQLIKPVLGHPEHPDYDDAVAMQQQIQAQMAPTESPADDDSDATTE